MLAIPGVIAGLGLFVALALLAPTSPDIRSAVAPSAYAEPRCNAGTNTTVSATTHFFNTTSSYGFAVSNTVGGDNSGTDSPFQLRLFCYDNDWESSTGRYWGVNGPYWYTGSSCTGTNANWAGATRVCPYEMEGSVPSLGEYRWWKITDLGSWPAAATGCLNTSFCGAYTVYYGDIGASNTYILATEANFGRIPDSASADPSQVCATGTLDDYTSRCFGFSTLRNDNTTYGSNGTNVNTTLRVAASSGNTVICVDSTSNMAAGNVLRLGANAEDVIISSVGGAGGTPSSCSSGSKVILTFGLRQAHANGAAVTRATTGRYGVSFGTLADRYHHVSRVMNGRALGGEYWAQHGHIFDSTRPTSSGSAVDSTFNAGIAIDATWSAATRAYSNANSDPTPANTTITAGFAPDAGCANGREDIALAGWQRGAYCRLARNGWVWTAIGAAQPAAPTVEGGWVYDSFTRSATDSWSSANFGGAYTLTGTASEFDVNGSVGTINHTGTNAARRARLASTSFRNAIATVRTRTDKAAVGAPQQARVELRWVDANNNYYARLQFNTNGSVDLAIVRVVSGTTTVLDTTTVAGLTHSANTWYRVRFAAIGTSPTSLYARVWQDGTSEPTTWHVETTDSSAALQVSAPAALWSQVNTGTSNTPVLRSFDDFEVLSYCPSTIYCPAGWSQTGKGANGTLDITTPTTEGDYRLWMWVTDNAGNISSSPTSLRVRIDNTAPTAAISLPTYTNSASVTLTATPTELPVATPSGIYQWRWRVSGAASWCAWSTSDGGSGNGASLNLGNATCGTNGTPAQGSHTIEYQVQDYAENISITYTATTFFDSVNPATPTITDNTGSNQYAHRSGNTVYFNGSQASSFQLTSTSSDPAPASGVLSHTFGALSGTPTGWTTSPNPTATTRLYIPAIVASGIQSGLPANWTPRADWEVLSASPALYAALTAPPDITNGPVAAGTGVAGQDRMRFAIAYQLSGSGTLGGNVKGQLAVRETNAAVDARAQLLIRVVSSDGSVERGLALGHDTGALSSEFLVDSASPGIMENRAFPRGGSQALGAVSFQDGDWLIIEYGHRNHGTNTSNVGYGTGGYAGQGDLPENETTQVAGGGEVRRAAWIEFSALPQASGAALTVAGNGVSRTFSWAVGAANTSTAINARDNATNSSTPVTISFVSDTTAPVAGFTTPAAGTTMQSSTSVNVAWTETETGSGVASRSLQRERGAVVTPGTCAGVSWANDGAADTNASPRNNTGLLDGYCYRWTQALTDNVANSASVTSGALLVDTTAPSLSFTTPAAGTTMQSSTSVNVAWTETETGSGVASRSLQRQRGAIVSPGTCAGVSWANDGAADTNASPRNNTGLLDGYCYRWTQTVTDGAGLSSGTITSGMVLVDTSAPAVSFSTPAAGTTMQNTDTVNVAWTETETGSGVASRSLQRQRGAIVSPGTCAGVSWANDGAADTNASPRSNTGLLDGYCYRWTQTLTDGVGLSSGAVTSGMVLVDLTNPVASATFSGGYIYQTGATVFFNSSLGSTMTVTASGTDAGAGIASTTFGALGGTPTGWSPSAATTIAGNDNDRVYSWDASAANSSIAVTVTDGATNVSAPASYALLGDNTPPTIAYSLAPGTTTYQNGSAYNLTFTTADTRNGVLPGSGVASVTLQRQSGTVITTGSCADVSWANDGAPIANATSPLAVAGLTADGTTATCYRWVATLVDNVGNSVDAASGSLMVDVVRPTGSLAVQGGNTTSNRTITVTPTANDLGAGVWRIRFAVDGGYNWPAKPWVAYTPGMTAELTLNSSAGRYAVMAQVQDRAGNIRLTTVVVNLISQVTKPNFAPGAIILDCDDPADQSAWVFNTSGTIYWPVDRELCLIPTVRIYRDPATGTPNEGTDTSGAETLYGRIRTPISNSKPLAGGVATYKLLANPNDPQRAPVDWPAANVNNVLNWNAGAPQVLRFKPSRENSLLSSSAPYLVVPYEASVQLGWFTGDGTFVRAETVYPRLELHIITKNSGRPTQ